MHASQNHIDYCFKKYNIEFFVMNAIIKAISNIRENGYGSKIDKT